MRIAVNIFLAASVHVALMLMAIKLSTTLVSGWRLPWAEADGNGSVTDNGNSAANAAALGASASALVAASAPQSSSDSGPDQRTQSILRAVDQGMMASASSDSAERSGFTRSFAMNSGDNIGNAGNARRETNDVTQALGRKYRPATIGAVRLKREGAD